MKSKVSLKILPFILALACAAIPTARAQTPADPGYSPDVNSRSANERAAMHGNADWNEDWHRGPYFTFDTNYVRNYEGDGGDNGINLSAKLGYDWTPYVGTEFETGWMAVNFDKGGTDLGTAHVVPLLINIPVRYPMGRFVPYVSGGTGVFLIGSTGGDESGRNVDMDNAAYGFKAAAGADYYINPNTAINFETGYYWLIGEEYRATIGGNRVTRDADLDSWYIGGGLKVKL